MIDIPSTKVPVTERLTQRFFYWDTGRTYYDAQKKRKYVLPRSGPIRPRKVLVLDEQLRTPLSDADTHNFRQLYLLEKTCAQRLGAQRYRRAYELLPESTLLCELVLLKQVDERLVPLEELRGLIKMAKTQVVNPLVTLKFKYCSRNKEGVLPLRGLINLGLICWSNHYSITCLTSEKEDVKSKVTALVEKKGLFQWVDTS